MDYLHALQRLSNHANAAGSTLPAEESFLFAVLQARKGTEKPALEILFDNIISCFEVINLAINTDHPSNNTVGKSQVLPRSLVADVSAILSEGWRYYWRWSSSQKFPESFCNQMASMLVQLSMAWEAVLAGDIDDLREHMRQELGALQ
jgi:hypothetical protein